MTDLPKLDTADAVLTWCDENCPDCAIEHGHSVTAADDADRRAVAKHIAECVRLRQAFEDEWLDYGIPPSRSDFDMSFKSNTRISCFHRMRDAMKGDGDG